MDQKGIENLKSILSQFVRKGCRIQNKDLNIDGRIVGIGFRPLWANPADSKIEKLELDLIDSRGRILPFHLYNIIGYDIVSNDGNQTENSANISIDIMVFSPARCAEKEPYEKIRLNVIEL